MATSKKRQAEIKKEWYDHTGWEFMEPHRGETFYRALIRNRNWLESHTAEACCIGDDVWCS